MSRDFLQVGFATNVNITDDLGNVLLDKCNAVHPQNLSRIIARALSGESNSTIYKLALGNGGTFIDATGAVSFRRPNDGIAPDLSGWQSRLYNETYNEVVDQNSVLLGTGLGTFPSGDPAGVSGVRSYPVLPTGVSQITVTCVLNAQEPIAQLSNSLISTTNNVYTFDELGLFTTGLPPVATQGFQDVVLTGKAYTDLTYLTAGTWYYFNILVDNQTTPTQISFQMPVGTGTNGAITYTDLKSVIDGYGLNLGFVTQVTQPGVNTLGNLRFRSITAGAGSAIVITDDSAGINAPFVPGSTTVKQQWLFPRLLTASGGITAYVGLGSENVGQPQGVEDNPAYPDRERERMLTHLIFSPLQKDAARTWKITYKLTVVVQQSTPVN